MKISAATLELIKQHEGCELKPYRCPAGLLTVGYGHVIGQSEDDLLEGITQEQANELLLSDLKLAQRAVEKYTDVALNENQYGALCSLTFNIGGAAFRDSTLRRAVNMRRFLDAANEFPRWAYAGKKKLPGLVARREAEKALFLRPVLLESRTAH